MAQPNRPDDGCTGTADQCFVMSNGNGWQGGEVDTEAIGCDVEYTFPSVTVQPGGSADISYAGTAEGATNFGNPDWTNEAWAAFYCAVHRVGG